MPDIEFPTSAGTAPGYLAVPAGERGPATIVLQEWWGVDEHIRSVCDRFAAEGFYALAPDLYGGETTAQPDEAQQRMMALSMPEVEKDMCGAAAYLQSQPGVEGSGVGSVGFCLGGGLSVWAATANPQIGAVATFYYVMPHGKPDFSKLGFTFNKQFTDDKAACLVIGDDAFFMLLSEPFFRSFTKREPADTSLAGK